MSDPSELHGHEHSERVCLYAVQALPASEVPGVEAQVLACARCREELAALRPVTDAFVAWPTDVLRPPASLWERLAERVGADGETPGSGSFPRWVEPEWKEVAPGISCKLLATDPDADRISMLVRLAPGVDYPPHQHAGREELHLLDGELWIDDRRLQPGDYSRAEAGTSDRRVWSETGCTCLLVTSPRDVLR